MAGIFLINFVSTVFILLIEILRPRKYGKKLDYLSFVTLMYIFCYNVVPIFILNIYDVNLFENVSYISKLGLNPIHYFSVAIIALLGYLFMLFGYYSINPQNRNDIVTIGMGKLLSIANILGIFGLVCVIVYTLSIGGYVEGIKYAELYRGYNATLYGKYSSVSFLKNLGFIIYPASFIYIALYKDYRSKMGSILRIYVIIMIFLTFSHSVFLLFHNAGRLPIVVYFISLLVGLKKGKFNPVTILLVLPLLLFLFTNDDFIFKYLLGTQDYTVNTNYQTTIQSIMKEFAFPYFNLAHSLINFNNLIDARFFIDVFLAIILLIVPERIVNIDTPDLISKLNSQYFNVYTGEIPIDILSLGYYSLGFFGCIIIMFLFGLLLRYINNIFQNYSKDSAWYFISATNIFFFMFRILYADPKIVIKDNFYIFIFWFLLFIFSNKKTIKK